MDCARFNFLVIIASAVFTLVISANPCTAEQVQGPGVGSWLTFAANVPEAGYRKTQFFDPHYNTSVLEWDSRTELWLPPFWGKFSWGPYVRVAGIEGSRSDAFQNAWIGGPGVGFQIYPLSAARFQETSSIVGKLFGA